MRQLADCAVGFKDLGADVLGNAEAEDARPHFLIFQLLTRCHVLRFVLDDVLFLLGFLVAGRLDVDRVVFELGLGFQLGQGRNRRLTQMLLVHDYLVVLLLDGNLGVDVEVAISRVHDDATLSPLRCQALVRIRPVKRRSSHATACLELCFRFSYLVRLDRVRIAALVDATHVVLLLVALHLGQGQVEVHVDGVHVALATH